MQRMSLVAAVACALFLSAAKPEPKAGQAELESLQVYVGDWKGVGQVRRGSTKGSWTEKSAWAWKFSDDAASLTFESPKGKYFSAGELTPSKTESEYRLEATSADGKATHGYVGKLNDAGVLVLEAEKIEADLPARITIRLVAKGARLIVLFERKSTTGSRYIRMSEVGYTRQGSGFGKGTNYVECVVTGGRGTIPVTFEGKTYYVCCGGCKDYFDENPAEVIAEYLARKEEEKSERAE